MMQSEFEIVRSYKHAKDRNTQIQILAELNADGYTDEAIEQKKIEIICILQKHGILEETRAVKKILRKKYLEDTKEDRKSAFEFFSKYVADCITAMDSASPKMCVEYAKDIEEVRNFLLCKE